MLNYQKILKNLCIFFLWAWMPVANGYGGSFAQLFKQAYAGQKTSFLLSKLTYESDVPFGYDEFLYLTELRVDSLIAKRHVDRAYHQLLAKKRFSAIDIDIQDYENGKHLHFKLRGNWILKKLDFRGIWFGKQKYSSLYTQHSGDIFDGALHEASVKTIKAALYDQGYFDCSVNDELIYEKKTKMITARVMVKRRSQFFIKTITYQVIDDQSKQDVITSKIAELLNKRFVSDLAGVRYEKQQLEKQFKKIKDFLKSKGFAHIAVSLHKDIKKESKSLALTCKVVVGKKRILKFKGNSVFSEQQINNEILGQDDPEWLFAEDVITEQLKYEYYKKGYWDVTFDSKSIGKIGYEFSIHEGPSTFIEQVEVRDFATNLPEAGLCFWPDLLQRRQFDQTLLEDGIEKLKTFYQATGYWDFRVVDKLFVKNHDTGEYTIQIFIEKGKQRLFAGFEIEGFNDLVSHEFFKKYQLAASNNIVPFNFNWLAEQRGFLLAHFQKLNYWYVDVQPELKVVNEVAADNEDPAKPTHIKIIWKINLGEQVKFGKILLRGNTRLPFRHVLKEVKFKEGDAWNKEKLDLTRKKLKRLDIFKSVQLQPYQMSKNKSKKPVVLTLIDEDPIEARFRLGYFLTSKNFWFKRQSTPKVGTSLIVRNPTNRADKLSFDADWTRFERKLNLDYQQPFFFNYSVMSNFKCYANKYIQPVSIGPVGSAYEAYQQGLLLGLSDEYKHDYHWGLSSGNEWLRTSRVRGYLNLDKNLIDRTLPYFFVEPSLIIDKLDDRLNTRHGGMSFLSLKCMIPEDRGGVTARLMAKQSLFYPLFNDIIVAVQVCFGYIFRRSFDHILPVERFFLGGPKSVRGYEVDALPPLGVVEIRTNKDGTIERKEYTTNGDRNPMITPASVAQISKEYTIQGGSSMVNGNAELRFPLIKNLGAVLFQDIGVLSQSGLAGFKSVWYPSSGVGLRYKTPIGAIRFDIGWKWKRRLERDRSYAWYLTLGEAF